MTDKDGRTVSVSARFDVKAPGGALTSTFSSPGVVLLSVKKTSGKIFPYAGWYLTCGNAADNKPCISFAMNGVASPPGFAGEFRFLQLVSHYTGAYTPGSGSSVTCGPFPLLLDNYFPYPFAKGSNKNTNDAPFIFLEPDFKKVRATFHAKMYLIWKASKWQDAIWVPIRYIDWTWGGTATHTGSTWILSGDVRSKSDNAVPALPEWSATISNKGTECLMGGRR